MNDLITHISNLRKTVPANVNEEVEIFQMTPRLVIYVALILSGDISIYPQRKFILCNIINIMIININIIIIKV